MQILTVVGLIAAVAIITLVAIYLMQRSLDAPGGREGLGTGGSDMFGGLNEIFNPGGARADDSLKEHSESREVDPAEGDGLNQPSIFEVNPDGTPRRVTIRRDEIG